MKQSNPKPFKPTRSGCEDDYVGPKKIPIKHRKPSEQVPLKHTPPTFAQKRAMVELLLPVVGFLVMGLSLTVLPPC